MAYLNADPRKEDVTLVYCDICAKGGKVPFEHVLGIRDPEPQEVVQIAPWIWWPYVVGQDCIDCGVQL